jgi:hypothetical protein
MKVVFEYDVDFMRVPLDPPTIGNCRKCVFIGKEPFGCIREDHRVCNIGRNGYFTKNYMHEVPAKEAKEIKE